METCSELLAICSGNLPVSDELPAQMPVTRVFAVIFYLRLNIRLGKQSWGWWFEMPSPHYGVTVNNFRDYRYKDINRLESLNIAVLKQNLSQTCACYLKYTVYILLGSLQNMNTQRNRDDFFVIFSLICTMDAPLWEWSKELLSDQIHTYLPLMSV